MSIYPFDSKVNVSSVYRVTQKNRTYINFIKSYQHQQNFNILGRLKYQCLYHHSSKFQLFWLLYIKVMGCLKYAPNGRNSIECKLADVTQNCQSFQNISLLGFLKFFVVLNAFSSSIFKLMAFNTAKNLRNLKREILSE